MTTIEFNETTLGTPETRNASWLRRWLARWQRRRNERKTLMALSQMDEHLLRDIGIEPLDVYDAINAVNSAALFDPARRRREHQTER